MELACFSIDYHAARGLFLFGVDLMELNRLYHMDCMEGMKNFPDGHFELAVVDPPYGVGAITYTPGERISAPGGYIDKYDVTVSTFAAQTGVRGKGRLNVERKDLSKSTIRGFGDYNEAPPPKYFKELFRVSKNQLIFGGNYFLLPPSRGFAVWRKTHVPFNFSMAMCEYIWTSFNANAKIFEANPQGKPGERIHPTQKPVKLYKALLEHYAKPGDKILDTHVGSGSSLIACHDTGHDYVGFELDADYHAAATKRIEEHKAQMSIMET